LIAITVSAINFLTFSGFERKFGYLGTATRTLPVSLNHLSLKTASIASSFAQSCLMTFSAINWEISGRFERKFGYSGTALTAFPVTLKHLARSSVIASIASFSKYHDNKISPKNLLKINVIDYFNYRF
jgi:hypothetical protein